VTALYATRTILSYTTPGDTITITPFHRYRRTIETIKCDLRAMEILRFLLLEGKKGGRMNGRATR